MEIRINITITEIHRQNIKTTSFYLGDYFTISTCGGNYSLIIRSTWRPPLHAKDSSKMNKRVRFAAIHEISLADLLAKYKGTS